MSSADENLRAATATTLTFCLQAPTMQELGEQVAALLGEQLRPEHELHVAYSSMQAGWEESPGFGQAFAGVHVGRLPRTTIFFEYSALVVLRLRS